MTVESGECEPVAMDSEDMLFMLYTSGSTGNPKGVAHTQAGYLLYASLTHKLVFDCREGDVFGCVADIGWITGHSYVVYGPLANGVTTLLFESTPTYPHPGQAVILLILSTLILTFSVDRSILGDCSTVESEPTLHCPYGNPAVNQARKRTCWQIRSKLAKNPGFGGKIFGAITRKPEKKFLETVLYIKGEPINVEAWHWYNKVVGKDKCVVVDTWWQTETGGICISPRPSAPGAEIRPGMPMRPMYGIWPAILNEQVIIYTTNCHSILKFSCWLKFWYGTFDLIWFFPSFREKS